MKFFNKCFPLHSLNPDVPCGVFPQVSWIYFTYPSWQKKESLEKILGKGEGLSPSLGCNWMNRLCVASVVDQSDFFYWWDC